MVIIVTKAKAFSQSGVSGEVKTVAPSATPVTVPDWVRDTATFKLGAQDGSCVEVQIQPPAAESADAPIPAAPSAMRKRRKIA
jgi:hypothetical protein